MKHLRRLVRLLPTKAFPLFSGWDVDCGFCAGVAAILPKPGLTVLDASSVGVGMGCIRPETKGKQRRDKPAVVLEKLCQLLGSAVRSFILTAAKLRQQHELLVKQQVSTVEARGVCVMF
jgi:hypothetical protein